MMSNNVLTMKSFTIGQVAALLRRLTERSQLTARSLLRFMAALSIGLTGSVVGGAMVDAAGAAPSGSASLAQCTNGAVGPPLASQPCVGSNAAAVSVAIAGINGGSHPGTAGPMVVVGHVSTIGGSGVFARLKDLKPGDLVTIN